MTVDQSRFDQSRAGLRDLTDDEVAKLESQLAQQRVSAGRALDFVLRKLARSNRLIIALEESKASVAALQSNVQALHARYDALATEHDALRTAYAAVLDNRNRLLASNSWRVAAPLRKLKSAILVALQEPHLLAPLVMANFRGRPRTSPPAGFLAQTVSALAPPVRSSSSPPRQVASPGTPEYDSLDQRHQLAAAIRHDVAARRQSARAPAQAEASGL